MKKFQSFSSYILVDFEISIAIPLSRTTMFCFLELKLPMSRSIQLWICQNRTFFNIMEWFYMAEYKNKKKLLNQPQIFVNNTCSCFSVNSFTIDSKSLCSTINCVNISFVLHVLNKNNDGY